MEIKNVNTGIENEVKMEFQEVDQKVINEELVKENELLRRENAKLKKELEAYKLYADLFEIAEDTMSSIVDLANKHSKILSMVSKIRK